METEREGERERERQRHVLAKSFSHESRVVCYKRSVEVRKSEHDLDRSVLGFVLDIYIFLFPSFFYNFPEEENLKVNRVLVKVR